MTRVGEYVAYHSGSASVGDIDPGYLMLLYVCDRFELNVEQRYWLAFLYAMTYCSASAFYVYNEFPDFENVDADRMQAWWADRGRREIICQTDRRWVRSSNQFVPAFISYREWVGGATQQERFASVATGATPAERYDRLYASVRSLFSFGQFSLFLYLEALHTITDMDLAPSTLDLDVAHSCRNGLCYAYGLDRFITDAGRPMPEDGRADIMDAWRDVLARLRSAHSGVTVWQVETTLCAYKKFKRGARYVGYYLDRQAVEIAKMQRSVRSGVHWGVLWQFRSETHNADVLAECAVGTDALAVGVPASVRRRGIERTMAMLGRHDVQSRLF